MRGVMLFIGGLVVGLTVEIAIAQNVNQHANKGVELMNHVGTNVPNIPDAVKYYTDKMGYKEAFRSYNKDGTLALVYMQISKNTFLELNQANAQRPAGFTHYGLQVESTKAAVEMFRQRGLTVTDPNVSGTKAILANISDPYMGGRIELVEPSPAQRKAINSWK